MENDIAKYYEILGLGPEVSKEAIKQAYKDLLNVWNPDSFTNDSALKQKAQEKINEIDEAYEKLIIYISEKNNERPFQKISGVKDAPKERGTDSNPKLTAQQQFIPSKKGHIKKIVFIIVAIMVLLFIFYPLLRYEKATVGRWELKYDRLERIVYLKSAFKTDAPWHATRLKSLQQAKFRLEQNLKREAAEEAMSDLHEKLEDIQQKQEEQEHFK